MLLKKQINYSVDNQRKETQYDPRLWYQRKFKSH